MGMFIMLVVLVGVGVAAYMFRDKIMGLFGKKSDPEGDISDSLEKEFDAMEKKMGDKKPPVVVVPAPVPPVVPVPAPIVAPPVVKPPVVSEIDNVQKVDDAEWPVDKDGNPV